MPGWLIALLDRLSGRAHRRGMQLLLEHLSPIQSAQFACHRNFDVTGGSTGRTYRIHDRRTVNVEILQHGHCAERLCFGPVGSLVQGDVLLAQKLALEHFENEVLLRANFHIPVHPERCI